MSDLVFDVCRYGVTFATRERAKTIGRDLVDAVKNIHSGVVLDFRGVRLISYSFADQLIREALEVLREKRLEQAQFLGCNDEVIQVLQDVLERRNRLSPAERNLVVSRG